MIDHPGFGVATIGFMGRNHFDPLFCESLVQGVAVIGFIPNQSFRERINESSLES